MKAWSRVVPWICSVVGRWFLGMRAEHPEYTPARLRAENENKVVEEMSNGSDDNVTCNYVRIAGVK
jgi:hypothetical protein